MTDEFEIRFKAAKKIRKEMLDGEGREVYKFCFNGREKEWDGVTRRDSDDDEIFTDFPATIAEDFAGELFTTMTPENAPWAEYETGEIDDDVDLKEAKSALTEFEEAMAKAIRKSNYYDEGHSTFKDAVVGNVAMWIERPTLNSPVVCEAIPIAETYLRLGPWGLDDRFRERKYAWRDLPALFPRATWSKEQSAKIKEGKGDAKVVWGFWRDYSDPGNPKWLQRIRVDNKPIGMDKDLGEDGSCPMVCGRFNADPGSPWGRGPGRRMLPTMRTLNELVSMNLEGIDKTLDPAYIYPNDGILDLSEGIESGMGYPAMPGAGESVVPLGPTGPLENGFFAEDHLEEILRDGFYRETIQRGKTPPSASQYLGDSQKQLRRIARPGAKTWREFGVGLLSRFEYLEREAGGSLENVRSPLIDDGKIIARPISPLERAQAGEDVLVAQSIMAMAAETQGPQEAAVLIDGVKTLGNVKEKLKDKIVEFRSADEIQGLREMMNPQPQQVVQNEAQ